MKKFEYKRIIKYDDRVLWECDWSEDHPQTPWKELISNHGESIMNKVTISFYVRKVK